VCAYVRVWSQPAEHGKLLLENLGEDVTRWLQEHSSEAKCVGGILKGRGGATRSAGAPGPRGGERKVLKARSIKNPVQFDAALPSKDGGNKRDDGSEGEGEGGREREAASAASAAISRPSSSESNASAASTDSARSSSSESQDALDAAENSGDDVEEAAAEETYEARSVRHLLEELHDFEDTSDWVLQVSPIVHYLPNILDPYHLSSFMPAVRVSLPCYFLCSMLSSMSSVSLCFFSASPSASCVRTNIRLPLSAPVTPIRPRVARVYELSSRR